MIGVALLADIAAEQQAPARHAWQEKQKAAEQEHTHGEGDVGNGRFGHLGSFPRSSASTSLLIIVRSSSRLSPT